MITLCFPKSFPKSRSGRLSAREWRWRFHQNSEWHRRA
jgi:hypothetical protein